ncbi:MAG: YbjQ family protein [Bryobacterales bacterium]|nr:YbjQ family protein [Acidobacteriota bacterium]MCB9385500.1 YbjQ family protein [Bryobacterales bacterium]
MIIVTDSSVAGMRVARTLGLVRGNTVRARHLGHDLLAFFRGWVGGEVHEYTKLLAESREHALDRMAEDAKSLGANAVIDVRFSTSYIATNMAEIMVYGTAVVLEPE